MPRCTQEYVRRAVSTAALTCSSAGVAPRGRGSRSPRARAGSARAGAGRQRRAGRGRRSGGGGAVGRSGGARHPARRAASGRRCEGGDGGGAAGAQCGDRHVGMLRCPKDLGYDGQVRACRRRTRRPGPHPEHPTAEEGCRPASRGLTLALMTCPEASDIGAARLAGARSFRHVRRRGRRNSAPAPACEAWRGRRRRVACEGGDPHDFLLHTLRLLRTRLVLAPRRRAWGLVGVPQAGTAWRGDPGDQGPAQGRRAAPAAARRAGHLDGDGARRRRHRAPQSAHRPATSSPSTAATASASRFIALAIVVAAREWWGLQGVVGDVIHAVVAGTLRPGRVSPCRSPCCCLGHPPAARTPRTRRPTHRIGIGTHRPRVRRVPAWPTCPPACPTPPDGADGMRDAGGIIGFLASSPLESRRSRSTAPCRCWSCSASSASWSSRPRRST